MVTEEKAGRYHCLVCLEFFSQWRSGVRHWRSQHQGDLELDVIDEKLPGRYECDICERKYTTLDGMRGMSGSICGPTHV